MLATDLIESLNLRDAKSVAKIFLDGAAANRNAPCRHASIDRIDCNTPRRLLATGDLHDHPLHLLRLLRAFDESSAEITTHLTLHELIHSDRLLNGMDFSYRMLARAAALKTAFPDRVHTLLANHELAQATGQLVGKDGIRCNEVFDDAIDASFGAAAPAITESIGTFIRSMPLALRCVRSSGGDILCSHALPAPERMDRFDMTIFDRDLCDEDYIPRTGSAHMTVWGRDHSPEQLSALANDLNVSLFILGHEKAEAGVSVIADNAVILNSDHDRGVYWPIDLSAAVLRAQDALTQCVALEPVA